MALPRAILAPCRRRLRRHRLPRLLDRRCHLTGYLLSLRKLLRYQRMRHPHTCPSDVIRLSRQGCLQIPALVNLRCTSDFRCHAAGPIQPVHRLSACRCFEKQDRLGRGRVENLPSG